MKAADRLRNLLKELGELGVAPAAARNQHVIVLASVLRDPEVTWDTANKAALMTVTTPTLWAVQRHSAVHTDRGGLMLGFFLTTSETSQVSLAGHAAAEDGAFDGARLRRDVRNIRRLRQLRDDELKEAGNP